MSQDEKKSFFKDDEWLDDSNRNVLRDLRGFFEDFQNAKVPKQDRVQVLRERQRRFDQYPDYKDFIRYLLYRFLRVPNAGCYCCGKSQNGCTFLHWLDDYTKNKLCDGCGATGAKRCYSNKPGTKCELLVLHNLRDHFHEFVQLRVRTGHFRRKRQ
ncbi:unnamed protein product [Auanema sp. JU1783]|nr:unnamed protein product [Auanema sp. JU1783]